MEQDPWVQAVAEEWDEARVAVWGEEWVIRPLIMEVKRVGLQMPVRWAYAYARNVAPRFRINAPRRAVLFNVRNVVQLWFENNKFKGG